MPLSGVRLLASAFSRGGQRRARMGALKLSDDASGEDFQAILPAWILQQQSAHNASSGGAMIDVVPSPACQEAMANQQCEVALPRRAWGLRSQSSRAWGAPPHSELPSYRAFSAEAATGGGHLDLPHHRFAVSVGSLLKVVAPHTDMEVDVVVGDDLETVALEAKWDGQTNSARRMKITSTHTDIAIKEVEGAVHGNDLEDHPFPVPSHLKAWIPERWCSVHLEAGRGSVSVQSVVEGHLHVETVGGNIRLGKVRGSASSLSSSGGNIEASSISAALMVRSGGGAVQIQRLLSNKLDMLTDGGDVTFGSVYGEWVTVRTNGGSLTAKHMRSTKLTSIFTGKGDLHIDGLDGNAKLSTEGGRVELQLHQHAKEVEVDSGGGDVVVYMPSTLNAKVEYEGTGHFEQEGVGEGASKVPAGGGSGRLVGRSGSEPTAAEEGYQDVGTNYSSSGRMDQAAQGPGAATLAGAAANGKDQREELPTCLLVIKGGKGNVAVKRRSWMELVAARSQQKTPADAPAPNFETW